MQCAFLHILNFPTYIVHRFMYCFFLYILCIASCLTLGFMYYVLLHVLRLTPCIACCFMPCTWLHARVLCCATACAWPPCLCAVSCLVLDSMPVCCVMPCVWLHACMLCHALCLTPCLYAVSWLMLDSMSVCHSIYPIFLHACQASFWTYIWVFNNLYPKFLWLTNRYPYFPFLLDIKSLTLLVYVQFSSDSIPFSHTSSLILDISCHFLFFISNFYPAKFVFHLHRPWLWIFPAIFS